MYIFELGFRSDKATINIIKFALADRFSVVWQGDQQNDLSYLYVGYIFFQATTINEHLTSNHRS
jgi:hypothetical protein